MTDSSLPLQKHMVFPYLPFQKGVPLQVVRWAGERVFSTLTASSSASLTLPSDSLLEITASQNCYIRFSSGTAVAAASVANDTNRLFLAGVQIVPVPIDPATDLPYTAIAAIRVDTDGHFQVESVL